MAPSRGLPRLAALLRASPHGNRCTTQVLFARRGYGTFSETLANPVNKVQSYVSTSSDAFLNLAIEDHILRTSPADSAVLFLYTNRPCVVIGRNQNPWHEVNLAILRAATQEKSRTVKDTEPPAIGDVQLVRRRSGGGTVFHDLGNVNWSIISPRDAFTRDKHAELVVRTLRSLGIERARVNERHDIVLDQGHERRPADPQDTHRTPFTVNGGGPTPLKVSGSAYKLTRHRALHHATTLLASPNLHIIPQYLHSPAKPYIDAKGVDSVSSPVGNIGLNTSVFQKQLQYEFAAVYADKPVAVQTVGQDHLNIPDIRKGYEELRTNDWILSQTPQFTLRLGPEHPTQAEVGPRLEMNVRQGTIKAFEYSSEHCSPQVVDQVRSRLVGQRLQDVRHWPSVLDENVRGEDACIAEIAKYLEDYLPIPEEPSP